MDLRYFFYRAFFKDKKSKNLLPDFVAVNGPKAKASCKSTGFPAKKLIDAEALRFLAFESKKLKSKAASVGAEAKLLVLTDYDLKNTTDQIAILNRAIPDLPPGLKITVKPHPSTSYCIKKYLAPKTILSIKPLGLLLQNSDIVFCSNNTASALEAYLLGLPLIIHLSSTRLNRSPLREYSQIPFVATSNEFVEAFFDSFKNRYNKKQDVFYLNKNLHKWKKILSLTKDPI